MNCTPLLLPIMMAACQFAAALHAGEWQPAASTNVTREYAGLALLPDGKVLAVSGHPLAGKSLASAEIYDPVADTWTPTGSLAVPRNGTQHAGLITLPAGLVMFAGGGSGSRSVHEVELYDYPSQTWTETESMSVPRCVHTSTQLESGDVLAIGGIDWLTEQVHDSAEIYDHRAGTWSPTPRMSTARFNHRTVRLADGRILVAGGTTAYPEPGHVTAAAEIYDPKKRTWSDAAPMRTPRRSHAMILLADGTVLVAGGSSGAAGSKRELASAEVYDPQTDSWNEVGPLGHARWGPTASLLADGKVLIVGGAFGQFGSSAAAEHFDPQHGTFQDAGRLNQHRNGHRAIRLTDGRILFVGGHSLGRYLASCEIYVP